MLHICQSNSSNVAASRLCGVMAYPEKFPALTAIRKSIVLAYTVCFLGVFLKRLFILFLGSHSVLCVMDPKPLVLLLALTTTTFQFPLCFPQIISSFFILLESFCFNWSKPEYSSIYLFPTINPSYTPLQTLCYSLPPALMMLNN